MELWHGTTKEAVAREIEPQSCCSVIYDRKGQFSFLFPFIRNTLSLLPARISCRSLITQKQSYKPPVFCVCASIILFMSLDYQGNKQRAFLWSGIFFQKLKLSFLQEEKKSTICLSLFLTLLITHMHFKLSTTGSIRHSIFQSIQKCPSMLKSKKIPFCSEQQSAPTVQNNNVCNELFSIFEAIKARFLS